MMKKAWAVLLAVIMLISSVSALAEGNPQDTTAAYSAGNGMMADVAFESDATFDVQRTCFVLDDGKDIAVDLILIPREQGLKARIVSFAVA